MSFGAPFGASPLSGMSPDDVMLAIQALKARQAGMDGVDPSSPQMPGAGMPGQPQGSQGAPSGPLLADVLGQGGPQMGSMGQPPSMLGGQMPTPQMTGGGQDAAASPAPPPMPPGKTGGNPPVIPPMARRPPSPVGPVAPSGTDEADEPSVNLGSFARPTPLPPARPSEFDASATGPATTGAIGTAPMTGPGNAASMAPGGAQQAGAVQQPGAVPAKDGPGFLDAWQALGKTGFGDQLLALSSGLLSGRGAAGWSQGIQNMQQASARSSANQLAQAEYGLKVAKARQTQDGLSANSTLIRRAFPDLTDQQAIGGASNSALVSAAIAKLSNPNAGRDIRQDADGVNRFTDSGAKVFADDEAKSEFVQAHGPDGSTMLYDKNDPAKNQLLIPGQVARPATPEERAQFGIPASQAVKMTAKDGPIAIGGGGVNVNMAPVEKAEQGAIGAARAGVIKEHIEAGRAARDKIQVLDQMRGALDAAGPNITTGALGEPMLRAKEALGGMLGTQLPGTSGTELFNNSGPVLAGAAARAITARPAQVEFTTMLKAKPGLQNSPEGSRMMMDVMRQGAVRDADLSDLASRSSSADEFLKKRDEYEAANPMINPFTGQAFGSASAPASAQSTDRIAQFRSQADYAAAPSGTRFIAPDGKLRVKP